MNNVIISQKEIDEKISGMLNYLVKLKDETGEFTFETSVGLVDDKSWNSWNWSQGVALYGVVKLYERTKDQHLLDIILNWYQNNLKYPIPERELNVNGMIPILALATLREQLSGKINNIDVDAYLVEWAKWAVNTLNKTPFHGFEHDTFGSINTNQLWDDTLVMAVLPLAKIGVELKKDEYVHESIRQFIVHSKFLMERSNGLWYHGWNFDTKEKFSNVFWGRGNAWITVFIPEFLQIVGDRISKQQREYCEDTLKSQIDSLVDLQTESGLWRTVLDDSDSYEESSATAGFLYGMLSATKAGIISVDGYETTIAKAKRGLLSKISVDGSVENVSAGTPVGTSKQFYKDIPITNMPYGQALSILALSQF